MSIAFVVVVGINGLVVAPSVAGGERASNLRFVASDSSASSF
jgi:hypothetical protein